MNKYKGEISLIGVTFFWGLGYGVIEYALRQGISPLEIQALRFIIGSLCILPLVLLKPQGFSKVTLKKGLILGVFMFSFFYLILEGQRLTNTSKAAFLTATYVLFVPFIDWVHLKTRPSGYAFLAAFLSILGVWLMSPGGFSGLERGDYFLLAGAFLVAFHMVLSADYVKDEVPIHLNAVQLGVTAILSSIALLSTGGFRPLRGGSLLAIIYIGVVATFIAYMLQTTGQKYTSASRASVLLSLEAPIGTLFGVLVFKDELTARMALGYLSIFMAIIVSEGLISTYLERRKYARQTKGQ
ncbi:MAG: EamA family transporter [Tissierellia bacterium]|nr:EamA family transporter [Tissierellia bacterium]